MYVNTISSAISYLIDLYGIWGFILGFSIWIILSILLLVLINVIIRTDY